MSETKIVGYKRIFGFILPDWVSERMIKTFIFGLLTSMVMLLVFIFVINPKFSAISALEKELEKDQDELVTLKQSRDGINRLQEALSVDEQRKILSAVPLDYSPDRAIFILREIASKTGASVVSYSLPSGVLLDTSAVETIGKKGEMVEFMAYPIKMVVAAPVDILLDFITKVESSLPFGVVSDLNLQEVTKLSKSGTNKNVQIALEIKYFQAKLNKININNIKSLTDANLEFVKKLAGFEEIAIEDAGNRVIEESEGATMSGDIFGI